jgi:hypothetical protein
MLLGYSDREVTQSLYNYYRIYNFPSPRLKFSCCVFVYGCESVSLNITEVTF